VSKTVDCWVGLDEPNIPVVFMITTYWKVTIISASENGKDRVLLVMIAQSDKAVGPATSEIQAAQNHFGVRPPPDTVCTPTTGPLELDIKVRAALASKAPFVSGSSKFWRAPVPGV
jgi:hypothetical protein